MGASQAIRAAGDWDLRGVDPETQLIGPITDSVIDADRLVRLDHRNGFPNFALYRLVLAGDRQYLPVVRQWWVMFSLVWCREHMRGGYSEELAAIAAWDSLQRVMEPAHPSIQAADACLATGVTLPTYLHARDNLRAILSAALNVYWGWIGGTYRIVKALERKV